jgi:hypothetical protein
VHGERSLAEGVPDGEEPPQEAAGSGHALETVAGELRRRRREPIALAHGDRPADERGTGLDGVAREHAPARRPGGGARTVAGEVATRLALAGGVARVAPGRVAVVTALAGVDDAVAADLGEAARRAAVARRAVAVVALLLAAHDGIAAGGRRAVRVAAVPVARVAVVARLAGGDDAVAAPGRAAVRVAAVPVGAVPVVAPLDGIVHAVAAGADVDVDVEAAQLAGGRRAVERVRDDHPGAGDGDRGAEALILVLGGVEGRWVHEGLAECPGREIEDVSGADARTPVVVLADASDAEGRIAHDEDVARRGEGPAEGGVVLRRRGARDRLHERPRGRVEAVDGRGHGPVARCPHEEVAADRAEEPAVGVQRWGGGGIGEGVQQGARGGVEEVDGLVLRGAHRRAAAHGRDRRAERAPVRGRTRAGVGERAQQRPRGRVEEVGGAVAGRADEHVVTEHRQELTEEIAAGGRRRGRAHEGPLHRPRGARGYAASPLPTWSGTDGTPGARRHQGGDRVDPVPRPRAT